MFKIMKIVFDYNKQVNVLLLVLLYFLKGCSTYSFQRYFSVCQDNGYIPKHGIRKPSVHLNLPFLNGSILRYVCDPNYKLFPSTSTQTCLNGEWVPNEPPACVSDIQCSSNIVVHNGVDWSKVPVPVKTTVFAENIQCYVGFEPDLTIPNSTCMSSGKWSNDLWCYESTVKPSYCPKPHHFSDGVSICCNNADTNHSDYCCSYGGKVQFECNPGYTMESGDAEWKCGAANSWIHKYGLPSCIKDDSSSDHSNHNQISDGMVKTLVGVITGVLSLLLIVVAFAFCKPKLKDIKRRWRDIREDEHGLIVDGKRVNLPSYEQATSSNDDRAWSDLYHQMSGPPPLNHLASCQLSNQTTSPPVSNLTASDIASSSHGPSMSHNNVPPPDWFNPDTPGTSRDQVTAIEFLRESTPSRRKLTVDPGGFEDSFVSNVNPSDSPLISLRTNSVDSNDSDVSLIGYSLSSDAPSTSKPASDPLPQLPGPQVSASTSQEYDVEFVTGDEVAGCDSSSTGLTTIHDRDDNVASEEPHRIAFADSTAL